MLWTIIIILLILMLVGPSVGYWNHGWGPTGGLGLVILIILILLLTGHLG